MEGGGGGRRDDRSACRHRYLYGTVIPNFRPATRGRHIISRFTTPVSFQLLPPLGGGEKPTGLPDVSPNCATCPYPICERSHSRTSDALPPTAAVQALEPSSRSCSSAKPATAPPCTNAIDFHLSAASGRARAWRGTGTFRRAATSTVHPRRAMGNTTPRAAGGRAGRVASRSTRSRSSPGHSGASQGALRRPIAAPRRATRI